MAVHNPSRGLSLRGGRSTVRRARSKNPTARRPAVRAAAVNPKRRRSRRRRNPSGLSGLLRNPASGGGLIVTAFMAGVAVSLYDAITLRVIPQTSPLVRVATKFGGALFFQSAYGSKVPLLGKYKNDVALVLAVAGMIDLTKLYILPAIQPAINQLSGGLTNLLPAPQAAPPSNATLGSIYGNAPHRQSIVY